MAEIQFSKGISETTIPQIRLTRSRSGQSGTARFYFDSPTVLDQNRKEEITGLYLIDEEGELLTREVKGKFINGRAQAIEAILVLNSPQEWDRFIRFMERYSKENGLAFTQSESEL
jgi:photosystem II protein